jgi:hypothetical protein
MADDLRKLLTYILQQRVLPVASDEAQLDATAVQDVRSEIAAITDEQRQEASRLAPAFVQGLRLATNGPLVVDDTNPENSLIVEAFARFLVAPNLATSQGEPMGDGQYRYTFEVNWPLLQQVAQRAGVDLSSALNAG